MTTKLCTKCRQDKPTSDFSRPARAKDGLQYHCKECQNGRLKATYADDSQRKRDYMRQLRYGITPQEYSRLNEAQGGTCAICGKECVTGNSLAVDHSHVTGEIRGLLCLNCNQGIGKFFDDPALLLKASQYLSQSNSL